MSRARKAAAFIACALLSAGCASDGTSSGGVGIYSGFYYDDYWWHGGGGCCIDYPGDIGPPHPEHPIVLPPGSDAPKPSHPIATPPSRPSTPSTRPMPSPRPAMSRGGGGRR